MCVIGVVVLGDLVILETSTTTTTFFCTHKRMLNALHSISISCGFLYFVFHHLRDCVLISQKEKRIFFTRSIIWFYLVDKL